MLKCETKKQCICAAMSDIGALWNHINKDIEKELKTLMLITGVFC